MDLLTLIDFHRERGLESGDFGHYRKYLGNRIVTMRRNLGCSTPPNKQDASPKEVQSEDIKANQGFARLLVLNSEKAWAQGMQMRSATQELKVTSTLASARRQTISKFHKAAKNATHLLNLMKDESSGFNHEAVLHVRAYQIFLCGALAFEKRQWEDSLQCYSEAHLIYNHIWNDGNLSSEINARTSPSVYIDTNLRYSAYQVGTPRSTSLEQIVEKYGTRGADSLGQEILDRRARNSTQKPSQLRQYGDDASPTIPQSIQWRSRTVKLEDAVTAQALGQVYHAEGRLRAHLDTKPFATPSAYAAAYDDILIASQDALDAAKAAIDDLAAEGVTQGDPRMQALQITRTFVHYSLIGWRIGRNRVLCGRRDGLAVVFPNFQGTPSSGTESTNQPNSRNRIFAQIKDQVVLHDSILQSLESVESLPGVASDMAFMQELQQKKAYFQTLRCLAIAQSHYIIEKYSHSLALLSKAQDLLESINQSGFSLSTETANDPPQHDISGTQLNDVKILVDVLIKERRGITEIRKHIERSDPKEDSHQTFLISNLSGYSNKSAQLKNVVPWPPQVQAIPVKPIFLDIAYNYINYPRPPQSGGAQNGSKSKTSMASEPNAAKKGWFGFGR